MTPHLRLCVLCAPTFAPAANMVVLAQEALLDGFAVSYCTIPLHRGADLPLLGITLFLVGILFII
jgi:hypothetical protein